MRIVIENLQIDFVNEDTYYYDETNFIDSMFIDNVFNVLANKVSAVLFKWLTSLKLIKPIDIISNLILQLCGDITYKRKNSLCSC